MRSYEVKQCFENCRVPPFFPLNFRVHHVFPWAMLFALVAVQPCLKASVHFLELLLQGPYFGEGNWKPFCRTYPFRALLQSPWFQICKPFCKAFFPSSDALGSLLLAPALFPLCNVPPNIISTRAGGSFPIFGRLCPGLCPQVVALLSIVIPGRFLGFSPDRQGQCKGYCRPSP